MAARSVSKSKDQLTIGRDEFESLTDQQRAFLDLFYGLTKKQQEKLVVILRALYPASWN